MQFLNRYPFCALFAAILVFAAASPVQAVSIDFQTPVKSVALGSSVSMELLFSSFPDPQILADFDLEVAYNSAILDYTGVTFGDPVNGDQLNLDGLAFQAVDGPYALAAPGFSAVDLMETAVSVPVIPLGEYLLATISFSTLAAGTADLWINVNALWDAGGAPMDVLSAGIGQITITNQPTTSVPEPGTLLLGAGSLGMLAASRKLIRRS